MSLFRKYLQNQIKPTLSWQLEETSGTVINDASGNGNVGTYTGITLNQPGLLPDDPDDVSVLIPNSGGMVANAYKPFPNSNEVRTFIVVAQRLSRADADTLLGMTGGSGGYSLAIVAGSSGDVLLTIYSGATKTWSGAWPDDLGVHCGVFIHDQTAGTAELIIDGLSQGVKTGGLAAVGGGANTATLGMATNHPGVFNGYISEYHIVERGISDAEAATLWLPAPLIGSELYSDLQPIVDTWGDPNDDLRVLCNALGLMIEPIDDIAKDGDNGEPGWSQALDLQRAKDEWLPWLGQWVGYAVPQKATSETQAAWSARERGRIVSRAKNRRATVALLREVIQEQLTGTKTVIIQERSADANTINVYVYNSEIATTSALVQAAALAAKAAGLIMNFTVLTGANYSLLQASNATYAVMTGKHANYNSVLTNPGL